MSFLGEKKDFNQNLITIFYKYIFSILVLKSINCKVYINHRDHVDKPSVSFKRRSKPLEFYVRCESYVYVSRVCLGFFLTFFVILMKEEKYKFNNKKTPTDPHLFVRLITSLI